MPPHLGRRPARSALLSPLLCQAPKTHAASTRAPGKRLLVPHIQPGFAAAWSPVAVRRHHGGLALLLRFDLPVGLMRGHAVRLFPSGKCRGGARPRGAPATYVGRRPCEAAKHCGEAAEERQERQENTHVHEAMCVLAVRAPGTAVLWPTYLGRRPRTHVDSPDGRLRPIPLTFRRHSLDLRWRSTATANVTVGQTSHRAGRSRTYTAWQLHGRRTHPRASPAPVAQHPARRRSERCNRCPEGSVASGSWSSAPRPMCARRPAGRGTPGCRPATVRWPPRFGMSGRPFG